jgi:hypothetical protein
MCKYGRRESKGTSLFKELRDLVSVNEQETVRKAVSALGYYDQLLLKEGVM